MEDKKLVLVEWEKDLYLEIVNHLTSKGIEVNSTDTGLRRYSEINTQHVRILILTDYNSVGYKADQVFGFDPIIRMNRLKDPNVLRYWGTVAEYVEEIENMRKTTTPEPEVKSTVRAIDAEKLVEAVNDRFKFLRRCGFEQMVEDVVELINEQPTLEEFGSGYEVPATDVALERGDLWIQDSSMPFGFKCTKCGDEQLSKTKFCPNCGAKMMNFE